MMNCRRPANYLRVKAAPLIAALTALLLVATGAAAGGDEAKRILALIDYIAGDYKNAVKGGKVINADEYQEMSEFAARSAELFAQLKKLDGDDKADIEKELRAVLGHIKNKTGEDVVPDLAQQIKERLIATYKIIPYPRRLPALADGKKVYLDNCAQCHGESGKGDGPGRQSMNPKTPLPANFTDAERIGGLSPFKVFNTTSFGIEGTAMASFAALSEDQRWQVAFYVFTLRFTDAQASAGAALAREKNIPHELRSTAKLSTLADEQLLELLTPLAGTPQNALTLLAHLRRGLIATQSADPLSIGRNLMRDAAAIYVKGDKEQAYQKAVEAYLDGFELAEPTLVAKDASLGRSIENLFTQLRNAMKQGRPAEEIQKQHLELEVKLDQAVQTLAQESRYTGYYAFTNSALITFREGLEAALILATIIATLRVMGAP